MDLRQLGKFIQQRVWIALAVAVLVEALMAGVTMLVSEQYQARSLVRLGKVEGVDAGTQGAVVEQVQMELEDETRVTVSPRPNGIVLINAEASTAAEAVNLANDATTRLIERSREAVELSLRERRATVEALKKSIEDVDFHIKELANGKKEGLPGPLNSLAEYMMASQLKELFDLRITVRRQLQQTEVELIRGVTQPLVLWQVKKPTEPFRPRWARNLIVGGIFGVAFGVFLVVLMGVLHQFAPNQQQETQPR